MAQCQKKTDKGKRCSNQAIPGTKFCQTHTKIQFKPVSTDTTGPPKPTRPKKDDRPVIQSKQPEYRAVPGTEKPVFPGLQLDDRNIFVAPQGILLLESTDSDASHDLFNRLVRLIGLLSQCLPLSLTVRIMTSDQKPHKALVYFTPEHLSDEPLSSAYDIAASAARVSNARLYIGEKNTFVQYRDNRAPRGYDVPGLSSLKQQENLLLIHRQGSQSIHLKTFKEYPLKEFCLHNTCQPDPTDSLPENLYLLAPRPYCAMLAQYFRNHDLHFGMASLYAQDHDMILFEIFPRHDASTENRIPKFILNYLNGLPRTHLLIPDLESNNHHILVQWQHRYPLKIKHMADIFHSDDMLLFLSDASFNMCISPSPKFMDGNQLTQVIAPSLKSITMKATSPDQQTKLRQAIVLRPDPGPVPPIAALILDNQEFKWMQSLLYQFQGDAFKAYALCQGKEQSILIGNRMPIEGIPFGFPLRRINDAELFIPLRSRFIPDLPWDLLQKAININDEHYTFFTDQYRMDIPKSYFDPLTKSLVADPSRPSMALNFDPPAKLQELKWTPIINEQKEDVKKKQAKKGMIRNLFNKKKKGHPEIPKQTPAATEDKTTQMPLRKQAVIYEQENDFLSAAICYSMLNDMPNSARCFRSASESITLEDFSALPIEESM
jgi:hypothetical protein